MKKLFLLAVVAVFGLTSLNAQEFKAGVNVGLPMGTSGDLFSFMAQVEANYLWEVGDGFQAGAFAGFSHWFGKTFESGFGDFEQPSLSLLPIGGAARFEVSDEFTVGADLGIGIGVSSGGGTAFYYAPKVQYSASESIDVVLSYRGAGEGVSAITLGAEFAL